MHKILVVLFALILVSFPVAGTNQVFGRCPNGYHKSPLGTCEKYIPHKPYSLPRCDDGYHRSPSGICEPVNGISKKSKTANTNDKHTTKSKVKSVSCQKGFHKSKNVCVRNKVENIGSSSINGNATVVNNIKCQGLADCFQGKVTEVVDGDTLDVNNVRIRLALVNTPEVYENGYFEARQFTMNNCGVGTNALVDEDDGQKGGSFGRMIGLVYCGNNTSSINEMLLNSSKASILTEFCKVSEFASSLWATKYGC